MQVFAIEEKYCTSTSENQRVAGHLSINDQLQVIKERRLAITKVLLTAGADPDAKMVPFHQCFTMQALAEKNENSGGPEVCGLLADRLAEPSLLTSACRLTIRHCLSRPIRLHGNVALLPVSDSLKRFVSMEVSKSRESNR